MNVRLPVNGLGLRDLGTINTEKSGSCTRLDHKSKQFLLFL